MSVDIDFDVWRSIPDGSEYVALPDSVDNQYITDNFTESIWPDEVGESDIDNISGPSFDSNAFGGDGGVEITSSDTIESDGLDDFGSNLDTDFAIAVGFSTEQNGRMVFAQSSDNSFLRLETDDNFDATQGRFSIVLADASGNNIQAQTTFSVDDGGNYAFIINKTGNGASDLEIYDAADNDVSEPLRDDGLGSSENFDGGVSYAEEVDWKASDIRWMSDSLNLDERQLIFDQYSWFDD